MNSPRETLEAGAAILAPFLEPEGFHFRVVRDGPASGGHFAEGEFVRRDRKIELHFRRSLGLVHYHIGEAYASHTEYMKALGVADRASYPGFSDDPLDGFRHLLADLRDFAGDFVTGDAQVLKEAAREAAEHRSAEAQQRMVRAVGDDRVRARMAELFRAKRFKEVVRMAESLQYPELLTKTERKKLEIARRRGGEE